MTPETKALIEQDAATTYPVGKHIGESILGNLDVAMLKRKCFVTGATPYAEKWEAAVEENKRLQEENETLRCQKDSCYRDYDFLYNENKRMRKALEYLAIFNRPGGATTYEAVRNAATEALKPKQ